MGKRVTWIFDEVPPSGTRRGGNPSEHAFEHDLDTFVREVLQNSNDVIVPAAAPVEVDFGFLELVGEDLNEFLDVLGWDELEPHLDAAGKTEGGGNLQQQLTGFAERERLRLLVVEDRNTEGLTGAEAGESSNFTALCKDTLYSHKGENTSAGGTHGLGKSVHWSFSGLSTVLFNSILSEDGEYASPRLIGRAELPSHELDDEWHTGSGWFGRSVELENGDYRAESVWDGKATELASTLQLTRDGSGTTVMIVGFRDPTRSEERSMAKSAEDIRAAAGKYFWPALMDNPRLSISTTVENDERLLLLSEHEEISHFVECYRALLRDETSDALETPGDIATRDISVEIPSKQNGQGGKTATATLVVRLAREHSGDLTGCVAPFRNAGMVIDYWDRSGVAVNARPFHAALVCGEARDPRNYTSADSALEEFLRLAEPPAHDDWQSTEKLRETYKQGYAKAIKGLKTDVRTKLEELTTPETSGSERGPDRLSRRFPISPKGRGGLSGNTGRGKSSLHFQALGGEFVIDCWEFDGTIEPDTRTHHGWDCEVSLHRLGEGGERLDVVPLADLTVESLDAEATRLDNGTFAIDAEQNVSNMGFSGRSIALDDPDAVGEVELGLTGTLHTEAQ